MTAKTPDPYLSKVKKWFRRIEYFQNNLRLTGPKAARRFSTNQWIRAHILQYKKCLREMKIQVLYYEKVHSLKDNFFIEKFQGKTSNPQVKDRTSIGIDFYIVK